MVKIPLVVLGLLLPFGALPGQAQDSAAVRPPRDSAIRNQTRRWPEGAPARRVLIGPMAGVNFAKLAGDGATGVKSRTGFQLGLFGSIPLGPVVSLQPSVAYSQQGAQLDDGGVTVKFKLNYIEAPLLLRLSAPLQGSGNLRPFFEAGPALAIEASCKVSGSNGTQSVEFGCDDDQVQLQRKKTAFSLHFGAGLEVDRLFLAARYQLGLSSIDDTGGDVKHRVIAIIAGYGFRLGH